MDNLPYPVLTDVLEVISAANESLDRQLVREKALDALFHMISAEGAIFFLPDGKGLFTYILLKNLDTAYCDHYRTYYAQFDPLHLTRGPDEGNGTNRLERTFSYDLFQPTEYYNDFLKPQKIHHKLIVNLVAEKELYGRIVLTRPKKSRRFTRSEVHTAKTVSPYLAHALAHNELRRKIKLKGTLLDYVERQSSAGTVLFDERFQIVYANQKAAETFGKVNCSGSVHADRDPIFSRVENDCREIRAGLESCPAGGMTIPRQSVVKGADHARFSVVSRVLDRKSERETPPLIMATIEEQTLQNMNPQHLMDTFHLSKREIDVVTLLFSGLKNAQIARKLFVSEVTVKKHLQNIYEKVGVSNRTTLINRILTE